MLKIRMRRAGGKNRPFFRVVVIDSRRARDSRAVEELGYYNPLEEPLVVNVNRERVTYWVGQGAQLSDTVRTLLTRENSVHKSRRFLETFEAMVPEERPAPKPKKGRGTKAEPAAAAVAVADPPAEAGGAEEPVAEKPVAEEPVAESTPAPSDDAAGEEDTV